MSTANKTSEDSARQNADEESKSKKSGSKNEIISDGPITIENGKVTFDRPQVTEAVEKEIYKSLQFRLNMAEQIEKRNPGGNAASRSMRDEYRTITQSHMTRFELSETDIRNIMEKGKNQDWSVR